MTTFTGLRFQVQRLPGPQAHMDIWIVRDTRTSKAIPIKGGGGCAAEMAERLNGIWEDIRVPLGVE